MAEELERARTAERVDSVIGASPLKLRQKSFNEMPSELEVGPTSLDVLVAVIGD